ncbi:MAG: flagellar motor protein MotA [Alphaproteobacteria bacterium]|nr:flagellar motor protein MotA [Alphaproteobacteria bacterium]
MARNRKRSSEYMATPLARSLSMPGVFLLRMLVFLALVGFIAAILLPQFQSAFQANPGLNGLIIAVLGIGTMFAFWQVFRIYPEVRWVNAFRIADPGLAIAHQPILLAPMATMLRDRQGSLSLSTVSMRSIMDSIGSRLDEARDTGRYLVGLLVFLGLLGTFWGLLDTIRSVGLTINALDTKSADSTLIFEELKTGLAAPLKGMGTAFASSLFGLSGSLVLGFLELQASQAHNRFYNELEEWLSGITELSPGGSAEGASAELVNRQLYGAMFEVQRSLSEIADRLDASGGSGGGGGGNGSEIADGINQLVAQMRREQEIIRQWADEQSSQQAELMATVRDVLAERKRRV